MKAGELSHISLVIGGFQKSGTTSLKAYLAQHPSIRTHPQVECSYFLDEEEFRREPSFFRKKYFGGQRILPGQTLMLKHAAFFRYPDALRRLREASPELHFVLLLRDPVERALSSYFHQRKLDVEKHSFEEVLDRTLVHDKDELSPEWRWRHNVYLGFGCYSAFLNEIRHIFPEDRLHLFLMEDLVEDPAELSQRIFHAIGVDPSFRPDVSEVKNRAAIPRSTVLAGLIRNYVHQENPMKKAFRSLFPSPLLVKSAERVKALNLKPVDTKTLRLKDKERLRAFYAPWNEELEKMSGLDLSKWRLSKDSPSKERGR